MPKEAEFFNAASAAEGGAPTTAETGGRSGSTSSAKYRVSSRPANLLVPSGAEVPDNASHSSEARLSATNVSSMLLRMNKNSASRLSISDPNGPEDKPKNGRYEVLSPPSKGSGTPKLPQKLRQHVNRLRSQFALGSVSGSSRSLAIGGRSPSPTPSPHKVPRPSLSKTSMGSRRFSIAAATALQYSRRSNQLQQLQAAKEGEKQVEPVVEAPITSPPDPNPTSVNAGTFQDLLRPLQNSLSCASLSSEWSSDEDDEAEQLFRQSERESSRMLRVCCSIDNLMVSVGDHAQEQKHTEAIARGATRELVKLFQFALKQAISVIFGKTEDSTNNNSSPGVEEGLPVGLKLAGKEAQYAMEFLLEINERIGKLYEFARSVFVSEVDGFRERIKELEEKLAAATSKNDLLQNEMRDLRDFYEQNNLSGGGAFGVGSTGDRHPELDNHDDTAISALAFPETPDTVTDADDGECGALKQQCQELSRLLDMAKQEIRWSHHERDVQKARVAEISSALFHDSELGHLRNQLQSEKKRVRILERENLTLREYQQDQALKLQALETLQAANSDSSMSSVTRHSIIASRRSSDTASTTTSATIPVQQENSVLLDDLKGGRPTTSTSELTIETQDNPYNFTSLIGLPQDGVQPGVMNWFSRMATPSQPTNVRKNRKKQTEPKPEQQPPVELSKFLAGLLMSDQQLTTAKQESKVRRQGSVPTLIPSVGTLTTRRLAQERMGNSNKRRPRSVTSERAANSSVSRTNSGEPEDNPGHVIAYCLQLVWVFYQRFLLAVEAQNLLCTRGVGGDPTMGSGAGFSAGSPAVEPVSLSLIIFHFFSERCKCELDAAHQLELFVRCLHNVRDTSYTLELFCRFLEESCSRQELCFFLWVCQAMDDVKLGISYDDPISTSYDSSGGVGLPHEVPTQFLCFLKATFLARTIFRLLHFKVLCRPPAVGSGKRRGNAKKSPRKQSSNNLVAAVSLAPSPASSPKRKPKTRLGELTAVQSPKAGSKSTMNNGESGQEEQKSAPLHVVAQTALREIIENSQGEPITLETFNNLLLKFAVVPSAEELTARLGPFYQPTGDERKIPTDVFLALLMETYKLQLQWQRDQLRSLFIHLNHQEELQQRAAEKLAREEAANAKGDRRKASEEDKKPRKPRVKRRKSRSGAADNGTSKYLRGLSRSVLRELLLQSGIVQESDMAQIDMNWLFAELLKNAGGVAVDITFDTVYDMMEKMRWLDSMRLRVDSLVQVSSMVPLKKATSGADSRGIKTSAKSRAPSVVVPSSIVRAIRNKWRVYARHSLTLCNNDPNVFIRRHTQRLLHYVDQGLAQLVNDLENRDTVNVGGEAIQCLREFLAFAWRVAGKRSNENGTSSLRQTCLTEAFLVSQALRATVDFMPGYPSQFTALEDKAVESQSAEGNPGILQRQTSSQLLVTQDALQCFYDTTRMDLNRFIKDKGNNVPGLDNSVAGQLHELESVLALYAAHIAHLFQRFSEARFNCTPQVSLHRWRSMVYELELVHPRDMPFPKLQLFFERVAEPHKRSDLSGSSITTSLDQELGVEKTQFTELFVLIAFERHHVAAARKMEKTMLTAIKQPRGAQEDNKEIVLEAAELADRPAHVMAQFCREILAPRAFSGENLLVERDFAAKLSCPLVGRALLEHRSFLRTVFFYYAKQDEVAADERAALEEQALIREIQENGGQLNGTKDSATESSPADVSAALLQPEPGSDFQLEKTKRSSMSFGEFQTFLTDFELLDTPEDALSRGKKVALADAQHVFASVMSLDNDDTLQLEFDEFAAAMVALAVHLNPSPFTLWHEKLDAFAMRLRRVRDSQNKITSSG